MKKEKKKWKILDHKEYLKDVENEHKEGDVLNEIILKIIMFINFLF